MSITCKDIPGGWEITLPSLVDPKLRYPPIDESVSERVQRALFLFIGLPNTPLNRSKLCEMVKAILEDKDRNARPLDRVLCSEGTRVP